MNRRVIATFILLLIAVANSTIFSSNGRYKGYNQAYTHVLESEKTNKNWTNEEIATDGKFIQYTIALSEPRNIGIYKFNKNFIGWKFDGAQYGHFNLDSLNDGEINHYKVYKKMIYGICEGEKPSRILVNGEEANFVVPANQDYFIWYVFQFSKGYIEIETEL